MRERVRYCAGWVLGTALKLTGRVEHAKRALLCSDGVLALTFHNPTRRLFYNSIQWLLQNGFHFITTDELSEVARGHRQPNQGAVWLSLDDGWKDNLVSVFPVVVEFGIPVCLFISTDPVERSGHFWWSLAKRADSQLHEGGRLLPRLMALPESGRLKQVQELEKQFGYQMPRESLTIEEVKRISSLPEVTLGCHTMHHVVGSNCSDSELESEIGGSKAALENWTGEKIRYFAYPHGRFDGREKAILESLGIEMAFTLQHSHIFRGQNPYYLPRFTVMDRGFLAENICHMLGLWSQWIDRLKWPESKLRETYG